MTRPMSSTGHRPLTTNLEPNDSFDHEAVELSTVPQVVRRIPCELLLHELELAHDHRRQEYPSAELPPVGARLAVDARELPFDGVVARGDEQCLIRRT